jgi:Spy/CpxP family protein refolding chaperone
LHVIQFRSLTRYAATAAMAAGLLLAQDTTNPAPGPGNHMAQRLDKLGTLLNLTEDQKTQIQTIFQSSFNQAKPLMTQMRDNRQAIDQLAKSGVAENFDQKLQALAGTQASLMSQLTVIHAKAKAQVWALLNPDQRTKADQLHAFMEPGGPGMMGGRPGMGPQGRRHGPPQTQ